MKILQDKIKITKYRRFGYVIDQSGSYKQNTVYI